MLLTKKETHDLFFPILKSEGLLYHKIKNVEARKSCNEEIIHTEIAGKRETSNIAQPGDFIVRNNTASQEQYVVKEDKFNSRYRKIKDLEDGWALYQAQGEVIAIALTKEMLKELDLPLHFYITPDWDTPQYVAVGDYIVMPPDESEIYRIAREEFTETYSIYSI